MKIYGTFVGRSKVYSYGRHDVCAERNNLHSTYFARLIIQEIMVSTNDKEKGGFFYFIFKFYVYADLVSTV